MVVLLDYEQIEVVIGGVWSKKHPLGLAASEEHIVEFRTHPLRDGLHRLVILIFDNDQRPGFYGWHDLIADLYVGEPSPPQLVPVVSTKVRAEPVVARSGYGVLVTSTPDRLQLAGNVPWTPQTELVVNVHGSVSEGERTVAVVVLQDHEQLSLVEGSWSSFMKVLPGHVSQLRIRPRSPSHGHESLRAVVITNPASEIAPDGTYDSSRVYAALCSQKVFIDGP